MRDVPVVDCLLPASQDRPFCRNLDLPSSVEWIKKHPRLKPVKSFLSPVSIKTSRQMPKPQLDGDHLLCKSDDAVLSKIVTLTWEPWPGSALGHWLERCLTMRRKGFDLISILHNGCHLWLIPALSLALHIPLHGDKMKTHQCQFYEPLKAQPHPSVPSACKSILGCTITHPQKPVLQANVGVSQCRCLTRHSKLAHHSAEAKGVGDCDRGETNLCGLKMACNNLQ